MVNRKKEEFYKKDQEILFWGDIFVFHEDPVEVGTVDSYVACHV